MTLIGSNGAGKSTTLRTISGLLRPRHRARSIYQGRTDQRDPRPRGGQARHLPVPGRSQDLPPDDGLGEPRPRRLTFARTPPRSPRTGERVLDLFPACGSGSTRRPAPCPVASSRCSPSPGRCLGDPSPAAAGRALDGSRASARRTSSSRRSNGSGNQGVTVLARRTERHWRRSRSPTTRTSSSPAASAMQGEAAKLLDDPSVAAAYLGGH